jgi:hypothetical protein
MLIRRLKHQSYVNKRCNFFLNQTKSKYMSKFPDDFSKSVHSVVPGATQWILKYPNTNKVAISIVGGGLGLYGDGVRTFEMYDFRESEPQGYLTVDEINQHLQDNPVKGITEALANPQDVLDNPEDYGVI